MFKCFNVYSKANTVWNKTTTTKNFKYLSNFEKKCFFRLHAGSG